MASPLSLSLLDTERRDIGESFEKHQLAAFPDLQRRLRLEGKCPAAAPAVQCLEALGVPHDAVSNALIVSMVSTVDARIERMTPPQLLPMAEATLELLSLPKLRSIPLKAIFLLASSAASKAVPEALVRAVIDRAPESVATLPLGFRRQAWALSPDLFLRHLEAPLRAYELSPEVRLLSPARNFRPALPLKSRFRRAIVTSALAENFLGQADPGPAIRDATGRVQDARRAFKTLAEILDRSEDLALHAARALRDRFVDSDGDGIWGTLLLDLVLHLERKARPLPIAPLFELAGILAEISDRQAMNDGTLRRLRGALAAVVVGDQVDATISDLRERKAQGPPSLSPANPFLQMPKPKAKAARPASAPKAVKRKVPRTKAEERRHRLEKADRLLQTDKAATPALKREIFAESWEIVNKMDTQGYFAAPVTDDIAPRYSQIVSHPMDLSTMKRKGKVYKTVSDFSRDFRRMLDNCKKYNTPDTPYWKAANRLERWYGKGGGEDDVVGEALSRLDDEGGSEGSDDEAVEDKPVARKPLVYEKPPKKTAVAPVGARTLGKADKAARSQLQAVQMVRGGLAKGTPAATTAASTPLAPLSVTPLKAVLRFPEGMPLAASSTKVEAHSFAWMLLAEPGVVLALRGFVLQAANHVMAQGQLPRDSPALCTALQLLEMAEGAAGALRSREFSVPDPLASATQDLLPTWLGARMALAIAADKKGMADEVRDLREKRGMPLGDEDKAWGDAEGAAKAKLRQLAEEFLVGRAGPGFRLQRGLLMSWLVREAMANAFGTEVVLSMIEAASAALRQAGLDPEAAAAAESSLGRGGGREGAIEPVGREGGKLASLSTAAANKEVRAGGGDASLDGRSVKKRKLSIKKRSRSPPGTEGEEAVRRLKVKLSSSAVRKEAAASESARPSRTRIKLKRPRAKDERSAEIPRRRPVTQRRDDPAPSASASAGRRRSVASLLSDSDESANSSPPSSPGAKRRRVETDDEADYSAVDSEDEAERPSQIRKRARLGRGLRPSSPSPPRAAPPQPRPARSPAEAKTPLPPPKSEEKAKVSAPALTPVLPPQDPPLSHAEARVLWDGLNEAYVGLLKRDSQGRDPASTAARSKSSGTPLFERCLESRFQVLSTAVQSVAPSTHEEWVVALSCREHVMYMDFVVAALQARAARKSVHLEEKLLSHLRELTQTEGPSVKLRDVWDAERFEDVRQAYEKLFCIAPAWRATLVG